MKGSDIVLHTEGKSEGNYCYTADAVRALLTILVKGENMQAYNVVNEKSHITIADMAKFVAEKIADASGCHQIDGTWMAAGNRSGRILSKTDCEYEKQKCLKIFLS